MSLVGKLLRALLKLALIPLLLLAALYALAHNEAFTARVLGLLPGLTVQQPQGALLGDFRAQSLTLALPRGGHLRLLAPRWQGLTLQPDMGAAWWLGVEVQSLSAHSLSLHWVPDPAPAKPAVAPQSLAMPLSLHVRRLQVAQADSALWGRAPLQGLDARLWLQHWQDSAGMRAHRLELAALGWQGWQFSGHAQLGVKGKMPADVRMVARGVPPGQAQAADPAQGQATVGLSGPLVALQWRGDARWTRVGQAAQHVALQGELQPFAPWPLARLAAQARDLNLARVLPGLPDTALTGELSLAPQGLADLRAQVAVRNGLAGAWDAGHLPVRQLDGHMTLPGALLQGGPTAGQPALGVQGLLALQARLPGSASGPGRQGDARLSLQGGWGGARSLRLDWTGLAPQAMHGRAPPLLLDGRLTLAPQWPQSVQGLAQLSQMSTALSLDARGHYLGSGKATGVLRTPMPVSLSWQGRYAPGRLDVSALTLRAQASQADLGGAWLRWGMPAVAWQAQGRLRFVDFDPKVWAPWPASVTGRNALSGQADVAVDANWRGQVIARLAPSVLGGVPLSGQAQWQSPLAKRQMSLRLEVDAGGNVLQAQAELPWQARPDGGMRIEPHAQWQARIHAPALQQLQAVAPLLGARQVAGVIDGQAQAQGAWPALVTSGQLGVSKLQWQGDTGQQLSLAQGQFDWQVNTQSLDAPARISMKLTQGQSGLLSLPQASWVLEGSARQHRSQMAMELRHQARAGGRVQAFQLSSAVQGQWQPQSSTWQGQFNELLWRTVEARPRVLLQAQPFQAQWRSAAQGQHVQVGVATVNVMGAAMQVLKADWQSQDTAQGPQASADVHLQLVPLNLPALLAQWQPQAGWGGDLVLGGQIQLSHRSHLPWVVDAVVQRESGDISLVEPTIEGNSAQRLGIKVARLALQARDGRWALSEQFEGRVLGVLKGQQVVQARAPDQLPALSDPLSGELDLQVANLRPWGTWLPAGWRLSGQLQAKAAVAGTLGAPQYQGQVAGQNLGLGQALMGVNLSEGQLQMALQGDQVQLTQLSARSGAQGGLLTATGQATLGEQPQATVSVTADRFALLQRVDRKVVVSGQTHAALGEQDVTVSGQIKVDEGLIDITRSDAPTVGEDVNVLKRPGEQVEEDEGDGAAANKRKVNVVLDVDLGRALRLKGRGLDAFLTGALRVSTPANKLAAHGTVRVENGTYAAYGQKLVLERGAVAFTGQIENPRLDILAMRAQSPTAASSDVKVGVNITGTALDPRVRLYSDPSMSETEKLSWLVLGRAPTGLGGADIGLLQTAAVALLSGEGSSPSDNLVSALGLDELSVRQSEGTVRETVVNVGKQVSRLWYVGYERNLAATSGNWQLIYRLAQRFQVRAQAGDDNAVDFIWSWRWD